MRRTVFDRIRAGEPRSHRRESGASFVDNVNFCSSRRAAPPDQLVGVCRVLPVEFSRIFGRPIAMDACELRERVRRPVLYLQFEGAIPGTTTMHQRRRRNDRDHATIVGELPRMLEPRAWSADPID
jgi:hypothetical protein